MFPTSVELLGWQVVNMEGLLHVGLPYLKTLTVIVRAASTAGKMDGVKLPDAVSGCTLMRRYLCKSLMSASLRLPCAPLLAPPPLPASV